MSANQSFQNPRPDVTSDKRGVIQSHLKRAATPARAAKAKADPQPKVKATAKRAAKPKSAPKQAPKRSKK